MKNWYTFEIPFNGSVTSVSYAGTYVGEALNALCADHELGADQVKLVRVEPFETEPKVDPDRIRRGVAMGIAALGGKSSQ